MIPVNDFDGMNILVTGASSGIGAAAARVYARCGARVALHYRNGKDTAEALAAEIRDAGGFAITVGGDLATDTGAHAVITETVSQLGGLDCLVNNAGGIERAPAAEADDELISRVFDLNMRSILRTTRLAKPHLVKSDKASIINLGSIAGRNGGAPGSGIYASAKAAVHSLTRSLAKELAPDNIRVNCIAPGVIATPFHDTTPKDTLAALKASIPFGRLGTAEECAWTFVFLASPTMAGYITGQIIDINGGQFMP